MVDIQPEDQTKVQQIMDTPCGAALQEIFIKSAILSKILPKIKKYAFFIRIKIDFIPTDAGGAIVDNDSRGHGPTLSNASCGFIEKDWGFSSG
jgi:hypothetical protein